MRNEHIITDIVEPPRLLLRWQAGIGTTSEERSHWIVAYLRRLPTERGDLVTLEYARTTDFENARAQGFEGYPAFPLTIDAYSESRDGRFDAILDVFMKRLPPRTRGDFGEYLAFHCLPSDAVISDFALLGYTGAKLPSDGFSFLHPFDDTDGPCEFRMDVAGWRHYRGALPRLREDQPVSFAPEPSNVYDPQAIQVLSEGDLVGYVPRGLTESFHRWFDTGDASAVIHSVPLPEERPELALFVTVRPRKQ